MLTSILACLMHDDPKNLGQVMLSGWSFLFFGGVGGWAGGVMEYVERQGFRCVF